MSDWDEHIKAIVVPGYVERCQIDLKTYCVENLVTIYIFVSKKNISLLMSGWSHCDLVTPYNDTDLYHHWLIYMSQCWFTISVVAIHFRLISQEVLQISTRKMSLKYTLVPHISRVIELIISLRICDISPNPHVDENYSFLATRANFSHNFLPVSPRGHWVVSHARGGRWELRTRLRMVAHGRGQKGKSVMLHACQGYPGYFRETHWISMGLPEISRVTLTYMTLSGSSSRDDL